MRSSVRDGVTFELKNLDGKKDKLVWLMGLRGNYEDWNGREFLFQREWDGNAYKHHSCVSQSESPAQTTAGMEHAGDVI